MQIQGARLLADLDEIIDDLEVMTEERDVQTRLSRPTWFQRILESFF